MKRMIVAGLLLVATSTLGAQEKGKKTDKMMDKKPAATAPGELSGEMADHFKGITLTPEQKAKIIEINKSRHAAMDKMSKGAKPEGAKDASAMKAAMQKEMDAEHADFKAVLTPEQYKVFVANMSKMDMSKMDMEKMKDGMKGMEKHDMEGMKHDMGDMKKDAAKDAKKDAKTPPAAPKKP